MQQLGRQQASDWFWVDWWLINRCDFHCGYCHDLMRNGSIAQIAAEPALKFVRHLGQLLGPRAAKTHYHLTGGEVTLWPWLHELLTEIGQQGAKVSMRSNLNQSPQQFRQLAPLITVLLAEYHPGFTQKSRFMMSVDLALAAGATVMVQLQMVPDQWPELEAVEAELRARWPEITVTKRMLYQDPMKNYVPYPYSPEQQQQLINAGGPLLARDGDREWSTNYQALVLKGLNVFTGWSCRAGVDQIVVDAWGGIYRANCRQGGRIGMIGEPFQLPQDSMICHRDRCGNHFDVMAAKKQID